MARLHHDGTITPGPDQFEGPATMAVAADLEASYTQLAAGLGEPDSSPDQPPHWVIHIDPDGHRVAVTPPTRRDPLTDPDAPVLWPVVTDPGGFNAIDRLAASLSADLAPF